MLIASCRRSWNRWFDSPALFTSRFHAIFSVFSVIGRMRSDTEFVWSSNDRKSAIAAPQSGKRHARNRFQLSECATSVSRMRRQTPSRFCRDALRSLTLVPPNSGSKDCSIGHRMMPASAPSHLTAAVAWAALFGRTTSAKGLLASSTSQHRRATARTWRSMSNS